jgi:hypothetical protein
MPICATPGATQFDAADALGPAMLALGLHTAAMLAAICAVALVVYDRVGVAFLRTGWVNLDWIWTAALGLCGVVLLVM